MTLPRRFSRLYVGFLRTSGRRTYPKTLWAESQFAFFLFRRWIDLHREPLWDGCRSVAHFMFCVCSFHLHLRSISIFVSIVTLSVRLFFCSPLKQFSFEGIVLSSVYRYESWITELLNTILRKSAFGALNAMVGFRTHHNYP